MDKAGKYLQHIKKLLHEKEIPELPKEYSQDPLLNQIHIEIKTVREVMFAFSEGDFSREVHFEGEFYSAFNSMVFKLNRALLELRSREELLKKSEAHFKFLANHDPLTNIMNRRSFIELAGAELANAAKLSVPCCIAMMDIDYFKRFNDTYGHLAGDDALRHVANLISRKLRKNDFIGRYGGEEFILFFYGANADQGVMVVERLRVCLADTPVVLKNDSVPIYASFGVAGSNMEDSNDSDYVQKLINDADTALYTAKDAGRNRVKLYDPEQAVKFAGKIPVVEEISETAAAEKENK